MDNCMSCGRKSQAGMHLRLNQRNVSYICTDCATSDEKVRVGLGNFAMRTGNQPYSFGFSPKVTLERQGEITRFLGF